MIHTDTSPSAGTKIFHPMYRDSVPDDLGTEGNLHVLMVNHCHPPSLFRNNSDGLFTNISRQWSRMYVRDSSTAPKDEGSPTASANPFMVRLKPIVDKICLSHDKYDCRLLLHWQETLIIYLEGGGKRCAFYV